MRLLNRSYTGSGQSLAWASNIATPSSSALSPGAGSFTFTCWISICNNPNGQNIAQFGVTNVWSIGVTSNSNFSLTVTGGCSVSMPGIITSGWHRLALVVDSVARMASIYVDGVFFHQLSCSVWSALDSSGVLTFGARSGSNVPIGGGMADAVYDIGHAWTAQQVSDDYFLNKQPSTITHRWLLNEGAGTTAFASVGGLNLTLSGGAAFSADSPMLARGVVRNFLQFSDAFDNAVWSKSTSIVTPNVTANPIDGAVTADELHITTNGGYCIQTCPLQNGKKYIYSCYVLRNAGSDQGFNFRAYDLVTTYYSGLIYATSTWQRLSFLFTAQGSGTGNVGFFDINNLVPDFYVYGAQLEEASAGQTTPSPYVATGATPLTVYGTSRPAQNLAKSSEDMSSAVYSTASGFTVIAGLPGVNSSTSATKLTVTSSTAYRYQSYTDQPSIVGEYYTGTVWLWTDTPGKSIGIRLASLPSGTALQVTTVALTTTPTKYIVTGACYAPLETAGITFGLDNRGGSVGGDGTASGTVFVDGMQLEKSNFSGPYVKTTSSIINTGAPRNQRQPQNLVKASETFTTGWGITGYPVTVTPLAAGTAPDFIGTAQTIAASGGTSAYHRAFFSVTGLETFIVGRQTTVSCFFKQQNSKYIMLGDVDVYAASAKFDLQAGNVVSIAGAATRAAITPSSNGFYRCEFTFVPTSPPALSVIVCDASGSPTFTPAGESIAAFGYQIEAANVAGTYVATTTTAVNPATPRNQTTSQNLFAYSEDWSRSFAGSVVGVTVTGSQPGIASNTSATKLAITTTAAYKYQSYIPAAPYFQIGTPFTFTAWLWTDTPGKSIGIRTYGNAATLAQTAVILTSAPTKYSISGFSVANDTTISCGFDNRIAQGGDGVGSGNVYCEAMQLEQSDNHGAYVKTGATAFNIGAPRKVA
jgi:hypothetical protein